MALTEPLQPPEEKLLGQSGVGPSASVQPEPSSPTPYPKRVPASRAVREQIRSQAWQVAAGWDRTRVLSRQQIEQAARQLLADLRLPEDYLGWTMVMLGSAFWQPQVAAVPVHRRLLLLPHCFRSVEQCQGHYTAQELVCRDCGACRLCFFRAEAKRLGYQVLIAEGTPIVLDMILHGRVDAILGVACLNSLERALEKILQVGIPCMAVPLWESRCRDSQTDEDWVLQMLRTPYVPAVVQTETYLHLLRATTQLFQPGRLCRFLPTAPTDERFARHGQSNPPADRSSSLPTETYSRLPSESPDGTLVWETTQRLAWDFLVRGGKHLRPFLTLAAYDAMTGARATQPDGRDVLESWPDPIWQLALAIEVFHKASLVHDDIEDDDPYRYGQPALHRQYGVPMALNVGDFLLGWGYRLAAESVRQLAPDAAADILAHLAQAHVRLSEGQGVELTWRQTARKDLSSLEVLKIYALKTAPAFEAALYVGLRLAGPVEPLQPILTRYSRQLGVAFQIQNDLADWDSDHTNKRTAGADVLGARPTILWALARQGLPPPEAQRLDQLLAEAPQSTFCNWGRGPENTSSASVRTWQPGQLAPIPSEIASWSLPQGNYHPAQTEHYCAAQPEALLAEVRRLYQKADAFAQARSLLQKHQERAHLVADQADPLPLKRLLHYVADLVINR